MTDSPTLFPAWLLVLFTGVVAIVLYLLFPGAHILDKLNQQPADTTSIHYMQALLVSNPEDVTLRARLIQELFETGQLKKAKKVLEPLTQQATIPVDMRLLHIQICFPLFFEATDPAGKASLQAQIKHDINTLYPQLEAIETLEQLANQSTQMGWPTLAAAIYQRILTVSGIASIEPYTPEFQARHDMLPDTLLGLFGIQSAQAQTQSKTHPPIYYAIKQLEALLAANAVNKALQQAQRHMQHFPESKELRKLAIKIANFQGNAPQARDWGRQSLQKLGFTTEAMVQQIQLEAAANDLASSLSWVQAQLKHTPDSVELLNFGIRLSTALQKTALTLQWSEHLLSLDPDNTQLLEQNIQAILQAGSPAAALPIALRRVEQEPNNIEARQSLAQIARWANKPEISLEQCQWLYLKNGDQPALKQTLVLAKALFQPDVTVVVLAHLGKSKQLTPQQMDTWYQALEAKGDADGGIKQLKAYLRLWPKHKVAWQYMIRAQLQTGALQPAINTLVQFQQQFGFDIQARIQQIQSMIELGQVEAAWQLAQKTREQPSVKTSAFFWHYYAEVASLLGEEQLVANSYKTLLTIRSIQAEELDWLLQFSRNSGDSVDYINLALTAWRSTSDPQLILDMTRYEMDHAAWEQATQILQLAKEKPRDFINLTDYWTIKAELAQHHSDPVNARMFIQQALKLKPDSANLYVTLLWILIDAKDVTGLQVHIPKVSKLAVHNQLLWEPLIAALQTLDQPKRTLPWYRKLIRKAPERYLLRLNYADALDTVGSWKTARLVRRHALSSVRNQLALKPETADEAAELQRRYTSLIQQHLGTEASHQWLQWLDQQHESQSALYEEFRIAWYLTQNQPKAARQRLLYAHQQRLQIPAWQSLAVALAHQDLELLKTLLQYPQNLSPSGQISGLMALRQETAALDVALHNLTPQQNLKTLTALRHQASELSLRNPNGFAASMQLRNINFLDSIGHTMELATTIANQPLTLSVQSAYLSSDNPKSMKLNSDQNQETAITGKWLYRGQNSHGWLNPALYIRDDESLIGVQAGFNYTLYDGWTIQAEGAFNEMSEESAPFRLLGARDRLTLGLAGELSKREYFNLRGHTRHYKTRGGDSFGYGYGLDFETGYRLHFENPGWNLALHGSWNQSDIDLDAPLPSEFVPLLPLEPVMASVLSDRYQEVGLKTQMNHGSLKPFGFVDHNFRYHMEAGLFYTVLAQTMGFQVSGDLGTRLFGKDELSLFGHFSDAQGGVNSRPSMSMGLRYSRRF